MAIAKSLQTAFQVAFGLPRIGGLRDALAVRPRRVGHRRLRAILLGSRPASTCTANTFTSCMLTLGSATMLGQFVRLPARRFAAEAPVETADRSGERCVPRSPAGGMRRVTIARHSRMPRALRTSMKSACVMPFSAASSGEISANISGCSSFSQLLNRLIGPTDSARSAGTCRRRWGTSFSGRVGDQVERAFQVADRPGCRSASDRCRLAPATRPVRSAWERAVLAQRRPRTAMPSPSGFMMNGSLPAIASIPFAPGGGAVRTGSLSGGKSGTSGPGPLLLRRRPTRAIFSAPTTVALPGRRWRGCTSPGDSSARRSPSRARIDPNFRLRPLAGRGCGRTWGRHPNKSTRRTRCCRRPCTRKSRPAAWACPGASRPSGQTWYPLISWSTFSASGSPSIRLSVPSGSRGGSS